MRASRAKALLHIIPWWLVAILGFVVWLIVEAVASDLYRQILSTVSDGIVVTVFVSLVAFVAATVWGLVLAQHAELRPPEGSW
jgi:ABC-type amino acid transport system permease subunit